jgi:hypothetical protein
MSIFSTQPTTPAHSGLLQLPAVVIPEAAPLVRPAQEIVESVITGVMEPVEPNDIPEHEIAAEAFLLFEARGCEHGHDVEDWLAAEALLRQRRMSSVIGE